MEMQEQLKTQTSKHATHCAARAQNRQTTCTGAMCMDMQMTVCWSDRKQEDRSRMET